MHMQLHTIAHIHSNMGLSSIQILLNRILGICFSTDIFSEFESKTHTTRYIVAAAGEAQFRNRYF